MSFVCTVGTRDKVHASETGKCCQVSSTVLTLEYAATF